MYVVHYALAKEWFNNKSLFLCLFFFLSVQDQPIIFNKSLFYAKLVQL